MLDYTYLYRRVIGPDEWTQQAWDVFITSYDGSERVSYGHAKTVAPRKHWVILPEYKFTERDYPVGVRHACEGDEADAAEQIVRWLALAGRERICIDISGFIAPYLMMLVKCLLALGYKKLFAIYTEPRYYPRRELTAFIDQEPGPVRQVRGFEGSHPTDTTNDALVIGVGYDDLSIMHAAYHKAHARKYILYGLPSLQGDMYQESVIKVRKAAAAIEDPAGICFAPASNPFATAATLREIVRQACVHGPLTNLYLAPLATKPQALGFALYWLAEKHAVPTSIIYPVSAARARAASIGYGRTWLYELELGV